MIDVILCKASSGFTLLMKSLIPSALYIKILIISRTRPNLIICEDNNLQKNFDNSEKGKLWRKKF